MSMGANMSSGYANILNRNTIRCNIYNAAKEIKGETCCSLNSDSGPKITQVPSMIVLTQTCRGPTPAEFALYPKVAVPCSVITNALQATTDACFSDNTKSWARFAKYNRFSIPPPCQALPQTANMAGISQPSTRQCNF